MRADLAKQVSKGRLTQDKANRLSALVTGSTDKAVFADADFVIEAVFENLDVKKQVFAEVEAVVSDTCILATNTSSLSVTQMAAGLAHPERVVGFHFFNPVAVMPLLEIVRAEQTDDVTLSTAFVIGKSLKKTCVLVKDAPAFVVNRLLTRYMGEIIAAVDEGSPMEVADRAMDPLGMPMSPLTLMDLVGPAVGFHVAETMHAAYPDRFHSSANFARIVAAGKTAFHVTQRRRHPRDRPRDRGDARAGRLPADGGADPRPCRRRRGRRGPSHARRGRRGRGPGHRPVHDHGRRLAVLARWHHAVPRPQRCLRARRRWSVPGAGRRVSPE